VSYSTFRKRNSRPIAADNVSTVGLDLGPRPVQYINVCRCVNCD